jgi:drug/metabolite transporter (DMT)-like permease
MTVDAARELKKPRSAALAGIGLMLLSVLLFTMNDALGKWIVATYSVGQFILLRSAASLVMIGPYVWRAGAVPFLAAPRKDLQLLRIALTSIEMALFFWAVSYLPLADTITFWLATPIYVTAFSPFFLGEKVGWRRWTAVAIGFLGVVLAMRPSAATFTGPALIAVAGSIIYAFSLMTTRALRDTSNIVLMTGSLTGSLLIGVVLAPFGWTAPAWDDLALIIFIALLATLAVYCLNRALILAPVTTVTPFQYTMIVWAVIFGYLMFGDIPDTQTVAGAAIIIAAGIFIFWREQRVPRPDRTDPKS